MKARAGYLLPLGFHGRLPDEPQRWQNVRRAHRGGRRCDRAATPKARELFRRELQRVPVHYEVSGGVEDGGIKLTAWDDDGHKAVVYSADEPQPAQKDPLPGIERALGKDRRHALCHGRPAHRSKGGGLGFLPGSAWNELRREALDKLLEKRSEVRPHATQDITLPAYPAHTVGQAPALAARFANAAQCPADAVEKLKYLDFPDCRGREHPQGMAGENAAGTAPRHVRQAGTKPPPGWTPLQDAGFAGAVVNNPAQLRYTDGWTLYGGLGLNVTNPMSAARYQSLGIEGCFCSLRPH